jgi:hypothetical protein
VKPPKQSPRGSHHDEPAAERIRLAKAKGLELALRVELMEGLSGDEQTAAAVALAEDFAALITEFPDVYPQPPIPLEELGGHARELREADEAARQAVAVQEDASRRVEEARRQFDAAAEQIVHAHEKSEEPKN